MKTPRNLLLAIFLAALAQLSTFLPQPCSAGPVTWTGAGGDGLWSNSNNWSAFAVPGASDDVVIPAPNDATIYYHGQQPKVGSLYNQKSLWLVANQSDTVLNFASGLTNEGSLLLSSSGGSWNVTVTSEPGAVLVNAASGVIETRYGTGGLRNFHGFWQNFGTITNDNAEVRGYGPLENWGALLLSDAANTGWKQFGGFNQRGGVVAASGLGILLQAGGRFNFEGGTVSGGVYVSGGELAVAATVTNVSAVGVGNYGRVVALESPVVTVTALSSSWSGHDYWTFTNTTLVVAPGVTNRGKLVLTSAQGGENVTVTNESRGVFVNGSTGIFQPLVGTGGKRYFMGSMLNFGTVLCDAPTSIGTAGAQHQNYGVVRASSGTATFWGSSFTNQPGGVLTGTGTLDFSGLAFLNSGSVSPGASPGTLSFTGNYVQGPLGRLDIEIASGGNDRLTVTGTATLDGTLGIAYPGDFLPPIGSSNRVLTCSALSGGFAATSGLIYYTNAALAVLYRSDSVDLVLRQS